MDNKLIILFFKNNIIFLNCTNNVNIVNINNLSKKIIKNIIIPKVGTILCFCKCLPILSR